MTRVCLAPAEILHGATCGAMRCVQNIKKQRQHRYGAEDESVWHTNINGALGEIAVAKFLGRYWDGMGALGDLHALDVRGVNVRWAAKDWYHLLLHPADPNDVPFVHVTGDAPHYVLHGWILARDGKVDQFWKDPTGNRPAFFVPASALLPMSTLAAFLSDGGAE